jgi:glycosyltransferase involved in cell wall biosynthesis
MTVNDNHIQKNVGINKNKLRVLVVYDYFDPAVLAGGPITSCINLVNYLHRDFDFYVFTSNRDMDGSELNVTTDQWIDYSDGVKVLYGKKQWGVLGFLNVIRQIKPQVLYLNGIYSIVCTLIPLLIARFILSDIRIVIAPRGMLQHNALAVKSLKKALYLGFFRRLVSINNISWHVTGEQEAEELLSVIPTVKPKHIKIIGNIPRIDITPKSCDLSEGVVKLVTIALIGPMKNILPIIRTLHDMQENIAYSLYGPIKDKAYWKLCLDAVNKLPGNVTFEYLGVLSPKDVPEILRRHDFYIQPSRSENFGHSIFEALMTGLPVITSQNTPWNGLEKKKAGWNVVADSEKEIAEAIKKAEALSQFEYKKWSRNARNLAKEYIEKSQLRDKYFELFAGHRPNS